MGNRKTTKKINPNISKSWSVFLRILDSIDNNLDYCPFNSWEELEIAANLGYFVPIMGKPWKIQH